MPRNSRPCHTVTLTPTFIPPESPANGCHAFTLSRWEPRQKLRGAFDENALSPPVLMRTPVAAETPRFTVNDRNDIEHDSSPLHKHTRPTNPQLPRTRWPTRKRVQAPSYTVNSKDSLTPLLLPCTHVTRSLVRTTVHANTAVLSHLLRSPLPSVSSSRPHAS